MYLGLLFWHSANELDSWAYLWPTVAVWLASWLIRLFWKNQTVNIRQSWFTTAPATITITPDGSITRIDV
jgi:hypothetical protein